MKKRYTLICLLFAVFFTVICSCSDSETVNEIPDYDTSTGDLTFDGKEFLIATFERNDACQLIPISGESDRGDKLLEHYNRIEQTYDCKINLFPSTDIVNKMTLSMSVGDVYANICEEWLTVLYKLIKADMLVPLNYFDCFSDIYSGKWGLSNYIDAGKVYDDYYAFNSGYWGLPTQQFASVLYFNSDYISKAGVSNPHEFYENKTWTWANFEDLLTQLVHRDSAGNLCGSINVTGNYYAIYCAVLSNGSRFVTEDGNGGYKVDLEENAIEAMDWWRDLIVREIVINNRPNTGWSLDQTFIDGEMAFTCQYSYHGTTDRNSIIYNLESSFGWLPFPSGPSAPEYGDYGTAITHGSRFFFIPDSSDLDIDMLSDFMNVLFEPFEGETGSEWKEDFIRQTFYDDTSADIYFEMLESAKDIKYELFSPPDFVAVQNGTVTPKEAIDKVRDTMQTTVDEFFEKYAAKH